MFRLREISTNQVSRKKFTVTMESDDVYELESLAKQNDYTFHRFIKSILLGYLDYIRMEKE